MDKSISILSKVKMQFKAISKPVKVVKIERTGRIQKVAKKVSNYIIKNICIQCDEALKKFEELDAKLKQIESSFTQQYFHQSDMHH